MQVLIFANLKERKLLQQIMDWSKVTHIKFQMVFVNNEKQIQQTLIMNKTNFIVVLNDLKTVKILKKLKKRPILVKGDWYSGVKDAK